LDKFSNGYFSFKFRSEDSEEDDDDIVGFDGRAKVNSIKDSVVKPAAVKTAIQEEDGDDDVDIDNI